MAVQVSYPGTYIEEFAPAPPIQGVGTSTAAFVGVAASGDIAAELPDSFRPAKITSWDQFKSQYGEQPVSGRYLWYAVRGFFQNGGQVCYVVRASNGDYDEIDLNNRVAPPNDSPVIRVRARQPGDNGAAGNPIQIEVTAAHVIPNTTTLFRPQAALSANVAAGAREVTLGANEGINFKPDDFITIAAGGERIRVIRVTGDTLRLFNPLANPYNAGDAVRLADAPAGTRTVRIRPVAAFPPSSPLNPTTPVAGTILTITQGAITDSQIVESVQTEPMGPGAIPTYRITFRQGLNSPFSMDPANAATLQSEEFTIRVTQGGTTVFENLSIDAAHPRYFLEVINNAGGVMTVELVEPPPPVAPPANLPADTGGPVNLTGGANENLAGLLGQDYIDALDVLRRVDDVNLVSIPDAITLDAADRTTVQQELVAHCEQLHERFAVIDALPPVPDQPFFGPGSIEEQRVGVDSTRGYAALYYPWLRVAPAGTGAPILVPPSGHVCGIMARSDNTRGVHKAPANEIVNGAVGVERNMTDIDQGQLNLQGINVIRLFQTGGRPVLWGARTTATDRNWQYVNVRRLFLYVEESIEEGIRYAVFEPNNLELWQKLKRTITDFLTRVWRDGGLFGAKAEDAFYVRIDETLNPFSEQQLGRLNIEIGMRPTYPAEFIIIRIGIFQGGSEVSES
jgi:phage tail sheath protein FI